MGYSCTAAASFTREAIQTLIEKQHPGQVSNYVPIGALGGFFEIGRERADGAITGSVLKTVSAEGHCRRAGSFKINPDGTVARFPGIGKAILTQAETIGRARYSEVFERVAA